MGGNLILETGYWLQDSDFLILNMKLGTRNLELGTLNFELETLNCFCYDTFCCMEKRLAE